MIVIGKIISTQQQKPNSTDNEEDELLDFDEVNINTGKNTMQT